jgi:hypothetical protein
MINKIEYLELSKIYRISKSGRYNQWRREIFYFMNPVEILPTQPST